MKQARYASATLGFALTGYLLPWDQKGYWATQVATSILSFEGDGEVVQQRTTVAAQHRRPHITITA